jgi:drug/metabolite transporter (DMT)-like permease
MAEGVRRVPAALLVLGVFLLFTFWSASFIVIEALLRPADGPARFDWLSLTAARFVPVGIFCAGYAFLFRRRESLDLLGRHWRRLALCGLCAVPGYNLALYAGQQQAVAAPIASLLTALAPLFVMLLSAMFLGERITKRRIAGFFLALFGLVITARAKEGGGTTYPWIIAMTALAPFAWSIHSVLTKKVTGKVPPLLWTYLAISLGSIPFLFVLPFAGLPEMRALDGTGWWLLFYLAVPCTIVGFALWTWLLSHLPATTVGFTIFLNPPMTTGYKLLLTALFPAVFAFAVATGEFFGGALMLLGVGVAVLPRQARTHPFRLPLERLRL